MGTEKDLESLAADIEAGRDSVAVPEELVAEPEQRAPPPKSLHMQIVGMKMGERLKLALRGNRDARNILIRDGLILVQRFVLQNPRVTDEEILAVARNRSANHELLETIAKKKEWVANYQIRLALVTNPKTPLVFSMRFVRTLLPRDLRQMAKSKNLPGAVNSAAKRLVMERGG